MRVSDRYCEPPIQYRYDSTYFPKPTDQALREFSSSLLQRFSKHDLLLANAVGILPLLQEENQLISNTSLEGKITLLQKRQQILNRLMLASTQIASLAAELDCEGERAEQLATYLDKRDEQRIRRLTIYSVILGAATTVATSLIPGEKPSNIVGIGGGVVSAGLSGIAAFQSNQTVPFKHARNLLTDIWKQPRESTVYPPMVWYVLTEKSFSNDGQYSLSHNIRQRWQSFVVDNDSPEEVALYFTEGGNYQADDLHNRANMLNQLQSSIRSIDQDLQSLVLSLSR
ncbi:hypothetical protein GCM10027347_04930 [Larkinella harenae]